MASSSYLVLGVNPTSNEASVELSTKITITFAKHINTDTLNSNTIRLRKVNGDFVDYKGTYDNINTAYVLTPNAPLSPTTQYQTIVLGGREGVTSIDGTYLTATKTYEFVTVEKEGIKVLENLELKQDYYFVAAQWSMPGGLTTGEEIYFNVRLSTSNNPEAFDLWPKNQLEGKTTSPSITIPYRLEPGRSYYVHVQGVTGDKETEWLTKQIYVEDLTPKPSTPVETPNEPTPTVPDQPVTYKEQLSVIDTLPQNGELQKPSEILVVFSHNMLDTLIGEEQPEVSPLFYVIQAPRKEQYTLLDLKSRYSPKNALKGSLSVDAESPNVLVWTPLEGEDAFVGNKEYTVIISKSMSGVDALPLGYTHTFSFVGTPEHLHGDLEHIKETLSSLNIEPTNAFLQSLMRKYSQFACDIWYESSTYDESLHQDGDAPYYINEYVNTQVLIDALLHGGVASMGGGDETIKLGDLTVTKTGGGSSSGASVGDVITQLQSRIKTWEDLIHGHHNRGYAKPGSTTKGESVAAYPEYLTRSELTTNFE